MLEGTDTASICGILPLDKPAGPTSHDIVQDVRRATGIRRVGHAGTLDPAATGLLVILVGAATRLARFVTAVDKEYVADVTFGTETDTCDAEGEIVAGAPVPPELTDPSYAASIVRALVGEHEQIPPSFSAVKREGEKAYEAARAGRTVELEPRPYRVTSAELETVDQVPAVTWRVRTTVSKGTYVRAIARDLGRSLGTVAHLSALRRTRSGAIDVGRASTVADVRDAGAEGLERLCIPALEALALPIVDLSGTQQRDVGHGKPLSRDTAGVDDGALVSLAAGTKLLAVYTAEASRLAPEVVVAEGCP
jgi:tRNA pseudouridine55 synthase